MDFIVIEVTSTKSTETYRLEDATYKRLRNVSGATPTKGSITVGLELFSDYASVYGPIEWNIAHLLTGLPIDDLVEHVWLSRNGNLEFLREQEQVHVSGHLDLTQAEFEEHYQPAINEAFARGAGFVVGDARGADTMAQEYLKTLGASVVVYHMFDEPRVNVGQNPTVGGFTSDADRDTAMTQDTDGDIAWVRPGREKSGTAKNLARRLMLTSGSKLKM